LFLAYFGENLNYISQLISLGFNLYFKQSIAHNRCLQNFKHPASNRISTSTHLHLFQSIFKMYTIPPSHRFLVLSAAESGPYNPANQFLVLSPTESGPDPRAFEESQTETNSAEQSPELAPLSRARTNSSSSTNSSASFNDLTGTLPNGFLYLGHGKSKKN
jgi:hypothetical protein